MERRSADALIEARELVARLRALAEMEAPTSLLANVLGELGLGDRYFPLETPLGWVYVAYSERGISAVRLSPSPEEFEERFRAEYGRRAWRLPEPPANLARKVERRLRENTGELRFDLRNLTEFERAVLLKALEIPRGEVRPYAWVAREIGHAKAVRAVGSALAHNPVPLLIPCHRVVQSSGKLGRYSLGSDENKRRMLLAEGVDADGLETLARGGVRYVGSDTTHIFCFPTCRHARRTTERHLVTFPSEAAAVAAGYRPCKVCRPALAG
ncbi:MAG TPA: methylated-DNA--[protein]-cysteine S-methyltransferase [Ktedonobacterales bacterium]|nr:methylated-DNA--[protein]-cysteine S-methyltransferase [Ktedonobacterales bacterium]